MKKFIIIGIIVFVLVGIFIHDGFIEEKNRKEIAIKNELLKNSSTDAGPLLTWKLPKESPGAGEYETMTLEGPKYKKLEPVELIFTDPYTGTPYGLLDRLSAIEKRLAEIEKILKEKK